MAVVNETVGPSASRKEWVGLAVIALACLIYVMDLSVLYLAVPSLTRDLEPSSTQLLWITDIYGFLVAGFLITMGTVGDRFGRRRVLLIGATAFGASSILAAFSASAEMLIGARALLGIAGATVAPSTLSLIRNMFLDPRQRTSAIGLWGMSFALGGVVGPLVGGALLEHFWWGSVFLINVPVMALLLVLGPRFLPEFLDPTRGRPDLPSAAMSLGAVLSIIYGLKEVAAHGFGMAAAIALTAGGVLGVVFIMRQTRLDDPLVDLHLFRAPRFSVSVAANTLGGFIAFGTFLYIAQYLQLVLGLSPFNAGLWSLPSAAGIVLASMLAPAILGRVRPAHAAAGALAFVAAGLIVLTLVDGSAGLPVLVVGSIVFALGLGPLFVLTTDLIVGSAPPERAGAASAISETGAELGGALGIAILGSVGTAIYRREVMDSIPVEVPNVAAAAARDTLGGALAVAEDLPMPLAGGLIEGAQAAFTQGLHMSTAVGAAITVVMAFLVVRFLRDSPASSHRAQESTGTGPTGALDTTCAET